MLFGKTIIGNDKNRINIWPLIIIVVFSQMIIITSCQQTGQQIPHQPNAQIQQNTFSNQQNNGQNNHKPQEIVYESDSVKISQTDRTRNSQQQSIIQFYSVHDSAALNNQFSFQILNAYQQFHFHLPTDQTIYLLTKVFVLKNNAYTQVQDIAQEAAVHLVTYQNNHKIIAQRSFYFQNIIKVQGKAGSTYMMRFYSPTNKLIIVYHNKFIQTSHFEGKVKSDKVRQMSNKLESQLQKAKSAFKVLRTTYVIEFEGRTQTTKSFQKYSKFQYVEIALVVLICIVQVRVINKLFKSDSIV